MSVLGYRHTGIVVDDMELQLKFYKDLLNLDVYYDQYEDGLWLSKILPIESNKYARIVKLGKRDTIMVELIGFSEWTYREMTVKAYNEVGITHVAFQVDNIDDMYENLKNEGVTFIYSPSTNPDRNAKVCFCYDFEGNLVELVQLL